MSQTSTPKLSSEMPDMTGDFEIDVVGEITKKQFTGLFTCKILTRKQRGLADRYKALLNGGSGEGLSLDIRQMHHRTSYLKYALETSPDWWIESDGGLELYDGNVLDEVYKKVLEFEEQWMVGVWGKEAIEDMKTKK